MPASGADAVLRGEKHDLLQLLLRRNGRVLSGGKSAGLSDERSRQRKGIADTVETGRDDYQTRCVLRWSRWTAKAVASVNVGAALLWICTGRISPAPWARKTEYVGIGRFFRRRRLRSDEIRFETLRSSGRVGGTLIKPTRQCGPRTGERI